MSPALRLPFALVGTVLFTLLLVASCTTSGAFREDLAPHFVVSAAAGFEATLIAHGTGLGPLPAAAVGSGLALTLGVAKESWDAVRPEGSGWSWDDLWWDFLGSSVGSSLAFGLLSLQPPER